MKTVVALLTFATFAAAFPYRPFITPQPFFGRIQPQATGLGVNHDSRHAVILRYDNDNIGVDGYRYAVETSDGQTKEEEGQVTNLGQENQSIVVRGSFSYVGPDGVLYSTQYIADDDGFHPIGAHLPVGPS